VLERRTKQLKLYNKEVFAATVGGIRLVEPSADLAMALAVASGGLDLAMAPHLVAIGEVGLTGEIRRVGAVGRRLAEAARLGFRVALVPPGCGPEGESSVRSGAVTGRSDGQASVRSGAGGSVRAPAPKGMEVIEVGDLRAALQSAARASAEHGSR
jgi:DNA repair protein RadA/Sms